MKRRWHLPLLCATLAGAVPAHAQMNRLVRFVVSPEDFGPTDIYWQGARGQPVRAEPLGRGFQLPLPAQPGLLIILSYRFGTSKYLPPSMDVRLKLNLDPQPLPLDLPLPLHRWKSCWQAAVDGLSGYPPDSTPSLLRSVLEARLLLTFRDGTDAQCAERRAKVESILDDRRRRLPPFISFP